MRHWLPVGTVSLPLLASKTPVSTWPSVWGAAPLEQLDRRHSGVALIFAQGARNAVSSLQ